MQAMLAAKKAKPDRDPFLCYVAKLKEALNDTEIAGIFRWFLTLKAGCMKQLPVALEVLRFIKRWNLHELYKQQFSIIKFWGDKVITAALTKCRSQKQIDQMERLGAAKIFRGPRGRTQKRPMLLLHMLRWLRNTCLIALLTLARSC